MIFSKQHAILVPSLNLSDELENELLSHINNYKVIPSYFNLTAKSGRTLWEKILFKFYFGHGQFQVYRLDDALEQKIRDYYSDFLKLLPETAKIRLKSSQGVRRLPPHSDAADGGDRASLTVAVLTNGEVTNWYDAGAEFKLSLSSLTKLTKRTSLCLGNGDACLFNNSVVHSVTNCTPGAERFVLTIGWQNTEFDQVVKAWGAWRDNSN
jgi:hypothetical protein